MAVRRRQSSPGRRRGGTNTGAGRSLRSLMGSSITGDDIEDYRTVPPVSFVLSPTLARPTKADVEIVRQAVSKAVLDGLRADAGAGDVAVSFDLGEIVELTFVPGDGDGRGGSNLRRRNLASPSVRSAAEAEAASRRTQDAPAYTVVGFGESKATYRAPLLSDFTPPSQTTFEGETWVAVMDDATAKIPDAIRAAVATATSAATGGSVLAAVEGATADLSYEPPSIFAEEVSENQPEESDGETLTLAPPVEEEVLDNTEQPDTPLTESQPPPVVGEPQQQEEDQQQQGNVLPMPTPEEEEDVAADTPAKEDEQQDTVPAPQDSAIPPPVFGAGEYTGEASVSSIGTAEGGDDTGGDPAIGAIVGGCMAALLAVLFIAAMFVKRRRRHHSRQGEGKRTKLQGDVEDQGELNAEKTFELDESGEIMQVEPADGNRSNDANLLDQGDDEDSEEEKAGGGGYLPTKLFGSFVGGNRSASRKATPRKSPKATAAEDDDDDEDSILTDWSGAPSVNSLGHSVQGSVGDDGDDPTSVANDLSKAYDLSKSRSGGANVLLQFKKKKEHKRSKSTDLSGQPNVQRTEEDFERHRNVASISLRKDMMCTVDSMSSYPMHGRSRSADHGLLASGTSLGTSSEAPEAGWIWGSRNEADMKPKHGGGQDLEML